MELDRSISTNIDGAPVLNVLVIAGDPLGVFHLLKGDVIYIFLVSMQVSMFLLLVSVMQEDCFCHLQFCTVLHQM